MAAEPRRNVPRALLAIGLALGTLVFTRVRGEFGFYVAMHRWLQEHGIADSVCSLDSSLLLVLASLVAAAVTHGPRHTLSGLGLTGSLPRGVAFALLAGLPMLVQGALAHEQVRLDFDTLRGTLVAAFVEELFFRATLVGIAVRIGGFPFWPTAVVTGLLFGSVHVPWNGSFGSQHLVVLAATTAGGIWYAWILRAHDWNLWTTIGLHAVMNAAWMVFAVADNAAGGLWPNVGRALTIAVGTVLTLRHLRPTQPG